MNQKEKQYTKKELISNHIKHARTEIEAEADILKIKVEYEYIWDDNTAYILGLRTIDPKTKDSKASILIDVDLIAYDIFYSDLRLKLYEVWFNNIEID